MAPRSGNRRPTHAVTFCNIGRAVVALVAAEGILRLVEIDTGSLARSVGGTVGLAAQGGLTYVALQAQPAVVAAFDAGWTLQGFIEMPEIRDLHGLALRDGELLAVSTGTNQVIAQNLATGALRALWTEPAALADTAHLNDVAVHDGRVLVSRFGPRTPAGQRNGEVVDLADGRVLVSHLREPHSVTLAGGELFVLESATGDCLHCRSGFAPRRCHGITGYARGLAVGPATIVIGKSGYRRQSRQGLGDTRLAPLAATAAADEAQAMSGLFFIDRGSGEARFVETTAIGHEIYGVLALPPDTQPPRRRAARRGG